jgi:hypothetical protein
MNPFLSVGETASLLGKSEKWVYAHLQELPGAFKLGGSWFIDKTILLSELKSLGGCPRITSPGDTLQTT